MKREILFNHPKRDQQFLRKCMGVSQDFEILWDSKPKSKGGDGPFPDSMRDKVGGLTRVGRNLVFDQALKDARDAGKATREKPVRDRQNAMSRLKALDLTQDVPQSALKDIVRVLTA